MARLTDAVTVVRKIGFVELFKRLHSEINEDNLFTWAAALAYSWLFAIFPFFIVVMTFLPYLPEGFKRQADKYIQRTIHSLPKESQETVTPVVSPWLDKLNNVPAGIRIVGLLITIWAASGGLAATMSAMDRAYDVNKSRNYFVQRSLAIALTLISALFIILVLVLIPVGTIAAKFLYYHTEATAEFLEHRMGDFSVIPQFVRNHVNVILYTWEVVRFLLAFVLLFGLVSIIYHFGPNIRQRYRILTPGAAFTITVWMVLGRLFRYYIDTFGKYNQTYGAVAGVAILLLFFYLDAAVLLIGAELNAEIDYDLLALQRGAYDFRSAERAHRAEKKKKRDAEPPPSSSGT